MTPVVRPFKTYHLDILRAQGVQPSQRAVAALPVQIDDIPGPAVTVFVGEDILICGGIIPLGPHSGSCWALVGAHAGPYMTWLHYGVKRFISLRQWRRLEATVEKGFEDGCRWLRLLGFEFEGEMRGYGETGQTHLRYGKVSI